MFSFSLKIPFLRRFLVVFLILVIHITLYAQNLTDAEIKTALAYNFLKYTDNPNFETKDTLIFGIYGDDLELSNTLRKLENEKINGKFIFVTKIEKNFAPTDIDALFVFNNYNFELTRIYKLIQTYPILLITDRAEEKRQVMINFVHLENNKVQFEINTKNLQESNFTLSPKLLLFGGSELDVRELYKETVKSLATEQERTRQAEQELIEKEFEVKKLTFQLNSLYARIDSLNSIIISQISNIQYQNSTLDSLSNKLFTLSQEALIRKQVLETINNTLKTKNEQIIRLDSDKAKKEKELNDADISLTAKNKEIKEKDYTLKNQKLALNEQSSIIESQKSALIVFVAFLIALVIMVIVIYINLKHKKKRSIELERRNKKINKQKEQIEFQAEELQMKNLELEKLSIVAEKTDNAVIILDKNGDLEWVNDGFERMQECALSEFIERNGYNLISASSNQNAANFFKICFEEKRPVTYNSQITNSDNYTKWIQSTLTPILDKNDQVEKFVIIDTDVSKLKDAENKIIKKNIEIEEKANDLSQTNQELEKQKIRAEKALKKLQNAQSQLVAAEKMASLGQLTSGIAHEINNPINYIGSSIEGLINILDDIKFLMKTYDEIADLKINNKIIQIKNQIDYNDLLIGFDELTGNIKLGVDRTKEIVNSLRTFSRVDDDNYSEIDLNSSIDSAITLLGKQHKEHIKIKGEYGVIPKIECMAGKVNQVFLNVLVNGVQSIDGKGEIKIRTSVIEKKKVRYAKIEFKDSGLGMTEETKEKLFEPFYTTKDVGEGTGLGLSITYSIIKKHHGFIEVESEVNKGTRFSIYLPLLKP